MKHNYYLLLVILTITSTASYAQVITRPLNGRKVSEFISFHSQSTPNIVEMKKVDTKQAIEEESKQKNKNLPPRYGIPISTDIGLEKGKWEISPRGGYTWKLGIKSPDATTLNAFFDKFFLPEGAELFAYNSNESLLFGPVTSKDNNKYRNMSTTLLQGDMIFLELFEPARSKGKTELHISTVVHGFVDFTYKNGLSGTGLSIGNCHNNIACPEGANVQNESNAVALMIVPNHGRWTTGTLLNNACNNLRPNFLAAFHSIDAAISGQEDGEINSLEETEVNNYCFIFNFRSVSCNGTEANAAPFFSLTGGNLTSSFRQTDFALITLAQRPDASTNIKYAGWDRGTNAPASTVGIHHPRGNIMKVCLDNNPPVISSNNRFWRVVWDDGTTERGSSGSGLFNNQNRLIGQLKGGLASCTNVSGWDEYGRISESWNGGGSSDTRLRDHLSDDPNVMQSNTISIPSLTIPDVICGNTNMTIANLPMNNLTLTGGGIQGAQLTNWFQNIEPIPGYNGPGFLELQLRPSGVTCNDPLIIRKDFWVGPPPVPDASIIENDDCRGFLSVANPEPNTSYSWKVTRGPNWYTYYLAGPTVFLHNWGPNYSWIAYELTASNSCGSFVVNGGGTLIGCGNPVSPAPDNLRGDSKANKWSAQLSPNPASNELNINLKEFSENKLYSMVDVKIVNMTGQIVLQTKKMLDRNMLIDIHSLTNGLYFIDIQGEGVSMRHKFSVSK